MKPEVQVEALLREMLNAKSVILAVDDGSVDELVKSYSDRIVKSLRTANIKTVHRDAISGKFISKEKADANPKTSFASKIKSFFGN